MSQLLTTTSRTANVSVEFIPTRWSLVLAAAARPSGIQTHRALEDLARAYWRPIYAFIRRQTASSSDAEDLTQDFFSCLLEKRFLAAADPTRGRFRSFLLTAVKHFLSNQRDLAKAEKRGGKVRIISLPDAADDMDIFSSDHLTPEQSFARQWALAVLDQVMASLRQQYQQRDQLRTFEVLKDSLVRGKDSPAIAEMALQVGISPGAAKVAIHRMRRQYRQVLRQAIAQTVTDPGEVDEEIRFLVDSL